VSNSASQLRDALDRLLQAVEEYQYKGLDTVLLPAYPTAKFRYPTIEDWNALETEHNAARMLAHQHGIDLPPLEQAGLPLYEKSDLLPEGYVSVANLNRKRLEAWLDKVRNVRDAALTLVANPGATSKEDESQSAANVELIPGGFLYKGKTHDLTGRPLEMLKALLKSCYLRLSASEVREALRVDDETVEFPEQVIKDTASELRLKLRKAVADAGLKCDNPLPSLGKGKDLTYKLDLP
jgi:hypothetical protein